MNQAPIISLLESLTSFMGSLMCVNYGHPGCAVTVSMGDLTFLPEGWDGQIYENYLRCAGGFTNVFYSKSGVYEK